MLRENMIPGLEVRVREFTAPSSASIEKLKQKPFMTFMSKITNWKPDKFQRNQITESGCEINNFASADGRWIRSELVEPWHITEGWKI